MIKLVLAFILIFNNGEFKEGSVVQSPPESTGRSWTTVKQCQEVMREFQEHLTADGITSTIGCFEVTPPNEKGPE